MFVLCVRVAVGMMALVCVVRLMMMRVVMRNDVFFVYLVMWNVMR